MIIEYGFGRSGFTITMDLKCPICESESVRTTRLSNEEQASYIFAKCLDCEKGMAIAVSLSLATQVAKVNKPKTKKKQKKKGVRK